MINRTFKEIAAEKLDSSTQQSYLVSLGWSTGTTWNDLLQSKRILIISEAGAGKTFECRNQARRLWDAGEPAFFVELSDLTTCNLRDLMNGEEETRLETWLSSQTDVATFFLDSFDELKLTYGSFERALIRLRKCIDKQLDRARIVITTRPIPFDEQVVRRVLPVPVLFPSRGNDEAFAKIAMNEYEERRDNKIKNEAREWRSVALMPLSDEQIIEFSRIQGVKDPDDLLKDLQRRNAQEFARRPQDLIELCVDWRENKRIRTHRDQVATNVRVKLLPRDGRREPAELSIDKAIEGASRLALAVQMMRRLTIRHSAASDVGAEDAALDPAIILSDWQASERKALLERPLFGFASYGRVRFHHRSVTEYLAAERLVALRAQGMSFQALKRLLFVQTKGKMIVRPSKRPLAGWLALKEQRVFELLRDNEPAVILGEGDPESLLPMQRIQALRAYVGRYGNGGWRDLQLPPIQIHRFASKELASEIIQLWRSDIENPEVREILLSLIEAGCIEACADLVFEVAQSGNASARERLTALDALVAIGDKRLGQIAACIAGADDLWPDQLARGAVIRLFPQYMSVDQLCLALRWIKRENSSAGDLSWQLPRLMDALNFDISELEKLRDGFVLLVSEGLKWTGEIPCITSDRSHLSGSLATICERGLRISHDDKWLHASVLALRTHFREHGDDEPIKLLREHLRNLNAEGTARLFWTEDALFQSLHEIKDPWKRLAEIAFNDGPCQLRADRDLTWVKEALGDRSRELDDRAMLLEAAISLSPTREIWKEHIEALRPFIVGEALFEQKLKNCLKPSENENKIVLFRKKQTQIKVKAEKNKAEVRDRWVKFWRAVANQPEDAFSPEKSWKTTWELWRTMCLNGSEDLEAGWNRRFIEEYFNPETADRVRRVLMKIWRDDLPTLPSERSNDERNVVLLRWQLGLAGIYAEAEDPDWAIKLNGAEAQLAARYVPIELNNKPRWLELLGDAHPTAVDQILGNELSWELNQPPEAHGHSRLLQAIAQGSDQVAKLFLPRLDAWLDRGGDLINKADNVIGMTERVRQVIRVILKFGGTEEVGKLESRALEKLKEELPLALRLVWLSSLIKVDPATGVEIFARQIDIIEACEGQNALIRLVDLFGDGRDAINLDNERFPPQLLLRILRLIYYHTQTYGDKRREQADAEHLRRETDRARNDIVRALFNAKGEDGLAAKLEMAGDPLFAHFKDRILAVAAENWAQEIDTSPFSETEILALDRGGEAPVSTNEDMFAILKDRLSDLDDLLLRDMSPREAWAGISDERVMRREIARELIQTANSVYTVDQEAVTADEKETDIRLRSTTSSYEGVIELKLGDRCSVKDLRDTIENQLVKKYMGASYNRSGVLLVTLAEDKMWKNPDGGHRINVDELLCLLRTEVDRVQEELGSTASISVHFLDLRPKLLLENGQKRKRGKQETAN